MKIKYSFFITFCLFLCLSFVSSIPVFAADTEYLLSNTTIVGNTTIGVVDRTALDAGTATEFNKGEDYVVASVTNPTVTSIALNVKATTSFGGSINSAHYIYNLSNVSEIRISRFDCKQGYSQVWLYAVNKDNTIGTKYTLVGLSPSQSITFEYVTISTGLGVTKYVEPVEVPISGDDILNFNWEDNGMQIYNLSTGMNVSGYEEESLKYFDIETYGKFTYQGDDTFFTTFAYKKMQTSIQLASVVTYGDKTRRSGEGLGIKSFSWVSDTSHLNNGDEVKFRIVYQVPMLSKGTYDIKIGTTINDGVQDTYISDTVTGVNFLNSNWVYGEEMDTSGETGNVGSEPGNQPADESSSSSSNAYSNMQNILTMIGGFSGFIGSLFSFLPSEVKYMFVGVCTLIVGLMVKRAVL